MLVCWVKSVTWCSSYRFKSTTLEDLDQEILGPLVQSYAFFANILVAENNLNTCLRVGSKPSGQARWWHDARFVVLGRSFFLKDRSLSLIG